MGTIKNYALPQTGAPKSPKRKHWILWTILISLVVLAVIAEVVLKRAEPILKGRVIETLSTRFNSHVELDDLEVSLIQGLAVSGKGLRIFAPDDVVAAGFKTPVIAIQEFDFHAGLVGLFLKPTHVSTVHVEGLAITIRRAWFGMNAAIRLRNWPPAEWPMQ